MDALPLNEQARRWLLAAGCFGVLMFFFSPPWAAFELWSRVPEMGGMIEVRRAGMVLYQSSHLGAELPDALHGAIQWRLLFPVIGRGLNLPPSVLLGLSHVGALLVLGFMVIVLRRSGAGWAVCGGAVLLLGATSWFFTSMCWLGYYDSWLVLGLLILAFADSRWSLWLACVWAPWVDERFVIAAPLALLCRFLHRSGRDALDANWKREFLVVGALVGGFAVVRLGILPAFSAKNATVGGYLEMFSAGDVPLSRYLFGVWGGLRLAWILVGLALALAWRRSPGHAAMLAAGTVIVMGVGLGTAQDLSRAMMLLMPVALLGALALPAMSARRHAVGAGAVVAALVLPAHHVITNHVGPIFYLHHELAAIDHPPATARSEWHELIGIQAMQRGDLVAAAESLSLAIKLASNPAGPAKQRGVLFASQQQWAEARQDFSLMVQHDPKNPDGWFLRAQAALALGDTLAAQADANQAVAIAPPGWQDRPDVARFLARLNPAPARPR